MLHLNLRAGEKVIIGNHLNIDFTMCIEKYFFEIPIYRRNEKRHDEIMMNKKNKMLFQYKTIDNTEHITSVFKDFIYYNWRYNDIVGWISLFVFGEQIRGDYYLLFSIKKRKTKKIEWVGNAFESGVYKDLNNIQIFGQLSNDIVSQCKEVYFLKNKHIDLSAFNVWGKYVNWIQLILDLGK
jgi:hypothetical protein